MDILSSIAVWLYQWQTLTAGLIAIVAAGFGWIAINRQIQQAERHEQDRVRRAFEAARAGLSGSLVSAGEYSDASFEFFATLIEKHSEEKVITGPIDFAPPPIPADAIHQLREVILNCSDKDVRHHLSRLISDVQIQNSRMRGTADDLNNPRSYVTVMRSNAIEGCLNALMVRAQSVGMLDYARRESESAPGAPSWDDIKGSSVMFRTYGFERELGDELVKRSERNYKTTLTT